jgi:hypothetical protein
LKFAAALPTAWIRVVVAEVRVGLPGRRLFGTSLFSPGVCAIDREKPQKRRSAGKKPLIEGVYRRAQRPSSPYQVFENIRNALCSNSY